MYAGGFKQVQYKEYICWMQVKIYISDQTSLRICNSVYRNSEFRHFGWTSQNQLVELCLLQPHFSNFSPWNCLSYSSCPVPGRVCAAQMCPSNFHAASGFWTRLSYTSLSCLWILSAWRIAAYAIPVDISVLQQSMLPQHVSVLLFNSRLCCPWTCLYDSSLCCPTTCLYGSSLCCPWTCLDDSSLLPLNVSLLKQCVLSIDVYVCLFYSSLYCPMRCLATAACASPGLICSTAACAVSGSVCQSIGVSAALLLVRL